MWIEMHDSARDHPKIIKAARDLGIPEVQMLGHMCSLWLWTLRMAPDGDLGSFDSEDIEIGAKWDGKPGEFIQACESRGLVDNGEYGYKIHDWMDFAGSLKSAIRSKKHRERKRTEQSQEDTSPSRDGDKLEHDSTVISRRPTDRPTDQTDRPDRPDHKVRTRTVPNRSDEILSVFEHYRTHHPRAHPKPKSTMKEWKRIRDRLGEGSTVADLCKAIDGMHKTPWNLGERENGESGTKFLQLELCMRSSGHVHRFMENADMKKIDPSEEAAMESKQRKEELARAIALEEEQDA